jgi:hypothetical protein
MLQELIGICANCWPVGVTAVCLGPWSGFYNWLTVSPSAEKELANSELLTCFSRCCSLSAKRAFLHEAHSWWRDTLRSDMSNGTCSSTVQRRCGPAACLRVMTQQLALHTSHTRTGGASFACSTLSRTGPQAFVLDEPVLPADVDVLAPGSLSLCGLDVAPLAVVERSALVRRSSCAGVAPRSLVHALRTLRSQRPPCDALALSWWSTCTSSRATWVVI